MNIFRKLRDKTVTIGRFKFNYLHGRMQKEDPSEDNDHYQVFNQIGWGVLKDKKNIPILDIGNTKYGNVANSMMGHKIDALVLKKPDLLSNDVNWIVGDLGKFNTKKKYALITAPSTLHLAGFGRYGDEQNLELPLILGKKLADLCIDGADLLMMLPLGKNTFHAGMHYVFDFDTIKEIYHNFQLESYIVDERAIFRMHPVKRDVRFSTDTDTSTFPVGSYKIIYLHFKYLP